MNWKQNPFVRVMLSIGFVLLTLESACRLFLSAEESIDIVTRDAQMGQELLKNLDVTLFDAEAKQSVRIQTNRLGFRCEELSLPKPETERRLIVLGDSFVAALGIQQKQTFCGLLEQQLNSKENRSFYEDSDSNIHWKVYNFGVPGSATAEQLLRYRHQIASFQPDAVLLCFGMSTDVLDNHGSLSTAPTIRAMVDETGQLKFLPVSNVRRELSKSLNSSSRFYVWQKRQSSRFLNSIKKRKSQDNLQIFLSQEPSEISESWKITAALLSEFQQSTLQNNTLFVVIEIPHPLQIDREQFEEVNSDYELCFDWDVPGQRLQDMCTELEIPLIRLEKAFRQTAVGQTIDLNSSSLYFGGKGHLTEKGHQLVAKTILDNLFQSNRNYPSISVRNSLGN